MSHRKIDRSLLPVLTLAAAVLGLAPLAAPAHADGEPPLERRTDVSLVDASPADSFQGFAKSVGLEADVDPNVQGKVTVRLHNVRMRTVLDAVCESIGCLWDVGGSPAKLHVRPVPDRRAGQDKPERQGRPGLDEPIDLKVTDADIREILTTFGQILSVNVDIDPKVTGKTTFRLENTPCREALDKVCAAGHCDWKLEDGKPPVLRVTARK